jgi:hypothetical protein
MSRQYQLRQLFDEEPAPQAVKPAGRLRRCATCDQIETPSEPKWVGLGLWHCKLDGIATYRSTQTADGALRVCDKGMRDAD